MELMSILNENNHSFFNPVDLTYEYVRKTEDEVVFSIYTIEDYKKIGEYRFWGNVSLDTVYIWCDITTRASSALSHSRKKPGRALSSLERWCSRPTPPRSSLIEKRKS